MWDLPDDKDSIRLLESFNRAGKVLTLMCHSPVALKNVKGIDGDWLIRGKRVTAFTNGEELTVRFIRLAQSDAHV